MKGWGVFAVVLFSIACGNHENSITGPYDQPVIDSGHGVAAAGSAAAANGNSGGRRRGSVSVPGQTATANGIVTSATASSLLVHRANGEDVTVQVTGTTVIRLHGTIVTLASIVAGNRVEARGTRVDDHTISAVAIEVEDNAGDDDAAQHAHATANGTVTSVAASSLVVRSANGVDTTVTVDANTRIKKQGKTIALSDIHAGDRVEAQGTRVDEHTILAQQVQVEESHGNGNP